MERMLERFPDEIGLSVDFSFGVRLFFCYIDLIRHPESTFESVLPIKIKNEVVLRDCVSAIIVPSVYRQVLECRISEQLKVCYENTKPL